MQMLNEGKYNPDVLTCIANLSSDEVFTPPDLANEILDRIEEAWAASNNGETIWTNPNVKFIDPFTKSGVFLREITVRLTAGLDRIIPDIQERVDHILTRQVFGIGITNLTALLSRRSVYCSKWATGEHSICRSFDDDAGNIKFERIDHTWVGGVPQSRIHPTSGNDEVVYIGRKCNFCGVKETEYSRGADHETYAYQFIHTRNPNELVREIFGEAMHFDVVIGNPPYQITDGGAGKSAKPIYHNFIDSAKALDPKYIAMIAPSRWMAGGKGLDDFRHEMLSDDRIRHITDFIDSSEAFPGVDIAGGVSYFLWDRDNRGPCRVETLIRGEIFISEARQLDEFDVFIRHSNALSIIHKIWPDGVDVSKSLGAKMSGRNAFGFGTNYRGAAKPYSLTDPIELLGSRGTAYVERSDVANNSQWIDMWKVTVSRASPAGGRPDKTGKFYGLSNIQVIPPGTVTTEAYPVVSAFDDEAEAKRLCVYLRSTFLRFLLTLRSANQSVSKFTFGFVPDLPMDQEWTDEALFAKYTLTDQEQDYIASLVRPMLGS